MVRVFVVWYAKELRRTQEESGYQYDLYEARVQDKASMAQVDVVVSDVCLASSYCVNSGTHQCLFLNLTQPITLPKCTSIAVQIC